MTRRSLQILPSEQLKPESNTANQHMLQWSASLGEWVSRALADLGLDSLFLLLDASNDPITSDLEIQGALTVQTYERHVQIPARMSGNAASQMTAVTVGTAVGLQASSAIDQYAGFQWEVPEDWVGDDIIIEIDWLPNSGAISGTDAVRWVIEYRSIAPGELITQGTIKTLDNGVGGDTADYAQYETKHTQFVLPFDDADQPLTKEDHIYVLIHRDTAVANDFTGTVVITAYEVVYNSNSLPSSN